MLALDESDDLTALLNVIDNLSLLSETAKSRFDAVCATADSLGGIGPTLDLEAEKAAAEEARCQAHPASVLADTSRYALATVANALRSAVRQGDLRALELHYKYSAELQNAQARLNESYREYLALRRQLNRVNSLLAGINDLAMGSLTGDDLSLSLSSDNEAI